MMNRWIFSLTLLLAPYAGADAPQTLDAAQRAFSECRAAASQKNEKLALSTAKTAETRWKAAAAASPADATPHIRLGQIDMECRIQFAGFMEKGRLMESIEGHLGRALELDPQSWDAHLNLGVLFYNVPPFLRRTDDAIHHLERTIAIAPERSALPYALLGDLYERTEDHEKAAAIRREGARRFPGDVRLKKNASNEETPAPAGVSSQPAHRLELIGRLSAIGEEVVKRSDTPGLSVSVMWKGDVLLERGYGIADVENAVPASEKSVYRLGSVSKQFLAATALLLEQEKVLRLDGEVSQWLDDAPPQAAGITLHRLLTHTAGLPLQPVSDADGRWIAPTLAEARRPGTQTQYSNAGYALAGAILERLTGRSYYDLVREKIALPAGLTQTTECDEQSILPHRAQGVRLDGRPARQR